MAARPPDRPGVRGDRLRLFHEGAYDGSNGPTHEVGEERVLGVVQPQLRAEG
jgi:hypothetical protein